MPSGIWPRPRPSLRSARSISSEYSRCTVVGARVAFRRRRPRIGASGTRSISCCRRRRSRPSSGATRGQASPRRSNWSRCGSVNSRGLPRLRCAARTSRRDQKRGSFPRANLRRRPCFPRYSARVGAFFECALYALPPQRFSVVRIRGRAEPVHHGRPRRFARAGAVRGAQLNERRLEPQVSCLASARSRFVSRGNSCLCPLLRAPQFAVDETSASRIGRSSA
mmetsp:Transcript_17549/g.54832  ORF Transcript_17549/g.54832 Transcript_17549/m.54832 type:complete len:223 (-) Transcript_17549:63-731(-)